MNSRDALSADTLPQITLHAGATLVSDRPLCVATPDAASSYAASFPVDGCPDGALVAELVIQVHEGSVGVSYVDRDGQNLRHEAMVTTMSAPCRIRQVIEPDKQGLVMIRTGPDATPARVEIHTLSVRPVLADELAAADGIVPLAQTNGGARFTETMPCLFRSR